MNNKELNHAGIKGMKWGIRRYQNPDGSLTPEGEKRYAQKEAIKSKREDNKNRRVMSDQELRRKVERLRLEKEMKNLTDESVNKGKMAAKGFLSKSGGVVGKIATTAAVGIGIYAVQTFLAGGPKGTGFKTRWNWQQAASNIKLKK